MLIKDMFQKPIDREIQGVIIVGQDENANISQELEEYVVTKELRKYFRDFFDAYAKGINGSTSKMGVWISGFFGSGKSHFLKILSYLLSDLEINGKHAIDYFVEDHKIGDSTVIAQMQLAAKTPTDAILFNIDAKSDSNGKQDKDAIVNVFLKVFNEMQGFCGSIPYLAELERRLTDEGRYEEFKEKFKAQYESKWEDSRQDFDFIQDPIVTVLVDMNFMSEAAARNWCEKAGEPYQISIEDFAKRVKKYIDGKGNDHHVVFLVDEVGQYIGDDSKLMLNLQTVTEELGKECKGKAWIIATSQQEIDSITKVKGNDFSKIIGRFDTRLALSSANVDEVIKKRILEKRQTADQTLRLLYEQKSTIIKNLIVFNDGIEKKLYVDEHDFAKVYPFVPYQFNLLASVLSSIRMHGASGKHLSEGERSMLAMFKESAMKYMGNNEGTIVPFYAFYNALENFLDHSHRGVIIKAYENSYINPEGKDHDVFAIDVLKALFMIKYVKEITANVDNITSLMISNIDDDRIALKAKVEDALKVLIRQMLVQKNGDIYVFLTNEEQEINREIEKQNVEMAEVINKVSELIFEDIFTDKKYRYPAFNGRYAFSFNQTVDDQAYKANQNYDIGVRILTPASECGDDEMTLRMMSGEKKVVLIVLPDDQSYLDEIRTHLKIQKYLRMNTTSAQRDFAAIKDAKSREMRERNNNAKLFLTEALKNAAIYVNGDKAQSNSKDIVSRINDAMDQLVKAVYYYLSYIDTAMGEEDIRKLIKTSNQLSLGIVDGEEANIHAQENVLQFVAGNTQLHTKTSMKALKDRFMKAPFGFVEDDVEWLVAKLFKRGDLAFTVNGASVTLLNKSEDEIINLITKKANVEKLLLDQRLRVPDKEKKIVRDVMKELFHVPGAGEEEDAMMDNFMKHSRDFLGELKETEIRYERVAYPGKMVIQTGKKLLSDVILIQSPIEFFHTVAQKQDALLDFAEDYEPVKAFFNGEQKKIFDEALRLLAIYNDSKTFIVDMDVENAVKGMRAIIDMDAPYREIPKLPELIEKFRNAYSAILSREEVPVLERIEQARKRVFEKLDGKEYKDEVTEKFRRQFEEIKDGAQHCNNVSTLRGFKDRADALKLRLLNQIDQLDAEIAMKKAEEAEQLRKEAEENSEVVSEPQIPAPAQPKPKKRKNVAIKSVILTSSWQLETEADIEKYLAELEENLKKQLEENMILNVEF